MSSRFASCSHISENLLENDGRSRPFGLDRLGPSAGLGRVSALLISATATHKAGTTPYVEPLYDQGFVHRLDVELLEHPASRPMGPRTIRVDRNVGEKPADLTVGHFGPIRCGGGCPGLSHPGEQLLAVDRALLVGPR